MPSQNESYHPMYDQAKHFTYECSVFHFCFNSRRVWYPTHMQVWKKRGRKILDNLYKLLGIVIWSVSVNGDDTFDPA